LRTGHSNSVCRGAILAAYLIEQAFKSELRRLNPLLYFDKRTLPEEQALSIAAGTASTEAVSKLRTASARVVVMQVCLLRKDVAAYRAVLDELFRIRNCLLHSVDDLETDTTAIAETCVSALRGCRKYVSRIAKVKAGSVNPLTSAQFEALQVREHRKRLSAIAAKLADHQERFSSLSPDEIERRRAINFGSSDGMVWVENTSVCPACGNEMLDQIVSVDFDWNPDGIITSSGVEYRCRICDLRLTEYELELIQLEGLTMVEDWRPPQPLDE
jgi:cell division protein FtsB